MPFDEFAARFHVLAHERVEQPVGVDGLLDPDLKQRPPVGVHRRLPQLVGVHLAETLVPLQRGAALAVVQPRLGGDALRLVVAVELRLSLPHAVQGWLCDVDVAGVDELPHLTEEEGQEQRPDVGAIDIGVRHDHDLAVSRP